MLLDACIKKRPLEGHKVENLICFLLFYGWTGSLSRYYVRLFSTLYLLQFTMYLLSQGSDWKENIRNMYVYIFPDIIYFDIYVKNRHAV